MKIKSVMVLMTAVLLCNIFCSTSVYANTTAKKSSIEGTLQEELGDRDYKNEIDEFVKQYEGGLASMEVSVFNGDDILYSGYYGYSNIEDKVKADENTVYDWGSCSKVLVWTSVMQLWEQGKIDFDKDIREYLPEGFLTKIQYPDEKITMLNLMSHNAGFQESFYENQLANEDELYDNLEDAVKTCQCFQAYHVGEYTAYSNWGTALAAYIVERVSGEDYVSYVNNHIFKTLGMEHTSIDPHMSDNAYVRKKRAELNCYYRGADRKDDEDYGTCYSWVQLYPAGSAIGTLEDFTKFGMAFLSNENPLFLYESTREEMFRATSTYGESDIAKTCHGFWTAEYEVQVLGHAGNTGGCSSNLQFDPVNKIGVVIMTNEPGETMFNYGIPSLLFGDIRNRAEYKNPEYTNEDISGTYRITRTIVRGGGSIMKYTGGLMPLKKKSDGNYVISLAGMELGTVTQIGEHEYLQEDNGRTVFLYESKNSGDDVVLEMMSMDMVLEKGTPFYMVLAFAMLFIGLLCVFILFVKLIVFIVRKARKSNKNGDKIKYRITLSQGVYAISLLPIIAMMGMGLLPVTYTYAFAAISGIMAIVLMGIQLDNIRVIICNFNKVKMNKWYHLTGKVFWLILTVMYIAVAVKFQFYNFWTL